jgi:hypothetical protein
MRYGVLRDVADRVLKREPIDLSMGHANVIWQGEANERALRALAHCEAPISPLNLSGPKVSIREIAAGLGRRLGAEPIFTGSEAPSALLVDCSEADRFFGAAARPTGFSARPRSGSTPCSTGRPTGSGGAAPAWASRPITRRAMANTEAYS